MEPIFNLYHIEYEGFAADGARRLTTGKLCIVAQNSVAAIKEGAEVADAQELDSYELKSFAFVCKIDAFAKS